jgi:hypothetical protein
MLKQMIQEAWERAPEEIKRSYGEHMRSRMNPGLGLKQPLQVSERREPKGKKLGWLDYLVIGGLAFCTALVVVSIFLYGI